MAAACCNHDGASSLEATTGVKNTAVRKNNPIMRRNMGVNSWVKLIPAMASLVAAGCGGRLFQGDGVIVRLIDQIEKGLQAVIRSDREDKVSAAAKVKAALVGETLTVLRDSNRRRIFSDGSGTYWPGSIGIVERITRGQVDSHAVLFQPGIVKIDLILAFTRRK